MHRCLTWRVRAEFPSVMCRIFWSNVLILLEGGSYSISASIIFTFFRIFVYLLTFFQLYLIIVCPPLSSLFVFPNVSLLFSQTPLYTKIISTLPSSLIYYTLLPLFFTRPLFIIMFWLYLLSICHSSHFRFHSFLLFVFPSPHIVFLSQSVLYAGSPASVENGHSLCGSRLCHEIAHSWFGLVIGARDWTEEWISEGFATYLEDIIWAQAQQVL